MISKLESIAKSKNDVISISETIRTVFDEPKIIFFLKMNNFSLFFYELLFKVCNGNA